MQIRSSVHTYHVVLRALLVRCWHHMRSLSAAGTTRGRWGMSSTLSLAPCCMTPADYAPCSVCMCMAGRVTICSSMCMIGRVTPCRCVCMTGRVTMQRVHVHGWQGHSIQRAHAWLAGSLHAAACAWLAGALHAAACAWLAGALHAACAWDTHLIAGLWGHQSWRTHLTAGL